MLRVRAAPRALRVAPDPGVLNTHNENPKFDDSKPARTEICAHHEHLYSLHGLVEDLFDLLDVALLSSRLLLDNVVQVALSSFERLLDEDTCDQIGDGVEVEEFKSTATFLS